MRLHKFRVSNYRCIGDSGWVELKDIIAVIGKNESGKTSLLRALHKLNPYDKSHAFNINREWPRGRRKERSDDYEPIEAEFHMESKDLAALASVFSRPQNVPKKVTVSRSYDGGLHVHWPALDRAGGGDAEKRQAQMDAIVERMPVMVYMGDYETFQGTAFLDQMKQRQDQGQQTPEDETVSIVLSLSGLDLDDLVARGSGRDREERQLDLNDAAHTLTNLIAERWTQRSYELQFTVDGQHFITHVKDPGQPALVPLEDRSKGFQWFLSFDMRLMHDTEGTMAGAVLLLDEPGLHLHGDAQADLLDRFEAYAENNQIIYTTHLPFMLDMERPDRFRIMVEGDGGWSVTDNPLQADASARFPLTVALGVSLFRTLFVSPFNLVVEGRHDVWYLSELSAMVRDDGGEGLDARLAICESGGASRVPYMSSFLVGQGLKVLAVLDSDEQGREARDVLLRQWILGEDSILMLGDALGIEGATIEDLFDPAYYVGCVNNCYKTELKRPLDVSALEADRPILDQVAALVEAQEVKFGKGRVAKFVLHDLPKAGWAGVGDVTRKRARAVVDAIGERASAWKGV